jgi:hypothetical protein
VIPAYKKKTNLGIGTFLAAAAIGLGFSKIPPALEGALGLVSLIGWFYGCAMYAKGKGYSGWLGALGIWSILAGIGGSASSAPSLRGLDQSLYAGGRALVDLLPLFVLVGLPDRKKQGDSRASPESLASSETFPPSRPSP